MNIKRVSGKLRFHIAFCSWLIKSYIVHCLKDEICTRFWKTGVVYLKFLFSKVVQNGFNNLSSFIYQRKYVKRKGKCSVRTKHWDDEKLQGKKKDFRKTTKMKLVFFPSTICLNSFCFHYISSLEAKYVEYYNKEGVIRRTLKKIIKCNICVNHATLKQETL